MKDNNSKGIIDSLDAYKKELQSAVHADDKFMIECEVFAEAIANKSLILNKKLKEMLNLLEGVLGQTSYSQEDMDVVAYKIQQIDILYDDIERSVKFAKYIGLDRIPQWKKFIDFCGRDDFSFKRKKNI